MADDTAKNVRVRDMARGYRWLVLLVGIQILFAIFGKGLAAGVETEGEMVAVGVFVKAISFTLAIALAIFGYQVASTLGLSAPALWAVGMFIPLVNILVLLALSSKAQTVCRQNGVRVGLLGPNKGDLAKLDQLDKGNVGE